MTTTHDQMAETVLRILGKIAPEADLAALDPAVPLREQLDLDSMDMLNFVLGVHKALQIDIPERDYSKLTTLDDCIGYLAKRTVPRT